MRLKLCKKKILSAKQIDNYSLEKVIYKKDDRKNIYILFNKLDKTVKALINCQAQFIHKQDYIVIGKKKGSERELDLVKKILVEFNEQ